ncbi:hypothetical protein MUP42_03810 [Candidatus Bathyarchaeota archaeon]|nr:hypothetical protein [Candidatus Bathyarchaeota archaeon]
MLQISIDCCCETGVKGSCVNCAKASTATADGVTEQDKAKVRNLENTGFDG